MPVGASVTLCAGGGCRARERSGEPRLPASAGALLCRWCQERLDRDLGRLPSLYEECGQALGGPAPRPWGRRSGTPRRGMPFNTAAAECRATMLAVLASWAELVAEERRVGPPERTVPALCAFLRLHVPWLVGHSSAEDASGEVAALVRSALRAIGLSPSRRIQVGSCVEPECPGSLDAHVPEDGRRPSVIRCTADSTHAWPGSAWTELEARMTRAAAREPAAAARWITPDGVARLWDLPRGSVYRLASERGWRRLRRNGRTYYAETDVRETMRERHRE